MLKTLKATPLPVALLVLSFLCPTELSLYVADLRLPPHRIAILLLGPLAVYRILTHPGMRIRAFDILFLLFSIWTVLAFASHGQGTSGLIFGGSQALECFGGYIIARAWVRDPQSFQATVRFLMLALVPVLLLALPETLLGRHFTHDFLQAVTGVEWPRRIESRFGLTRAYATFDHPIHLGTFCASLFAIGWYMTNRPLTRTGRAALVATATLAALSSAPILCLLAQVGLICLDSLTRGMLHRAKFAIAIVTIVAVGFGLFTEQGLIPFIATGLTIDSWTGYYRLLIWEHGLLNVWAHPWLGIGLGEWTRPWWMASSSVDAFWLVIALRTGLPAVLLLGVAIAALTWAGVSRAESVPDPIYRRAMKAWVISLIALVLVGCTVHYWNVLQSFFFFFLGLAGWIADPRRRTMRRQQPQRQQYAGSHPRTATLPRHPLPA